MSNTQIITPQTKSEIKIYYQIRFDELRKPWGRPIGSEKDSMEDECVHRMLKVDQKFIGVGRLQYNTDSQGQIRYMAILKDYQRQGYGRMMILDLEKNAKDNGIREIILQSREVAVKFYQSLGYKVEKKTYLLFEDIQHFLMRKYL